MFIQKDDHAIKLPLVEGSTDSWSSSGAADVALPDVHNTGLFLGGVGNTGLFL